MKRDILKYCAAALPLLSMANGCGNTPEPFVPHAFPVTEIPSMISSRQDKMEYMATHFWDEFTDTSVLYPCDSSIVNGVPRSEVEQAFSSWSIVIQNIGFRDAEKAAERLFDKVAAIENKDTASTVFETVASLAKRYLYDPNSPVRNEDLYYPFASRLARWDGLEEDDRAIYAHEARMCSLNRTGTPAADFTFCDRYGKTHTLYGIEADYTLLFFSNPGCPACKNIADAIQSDPVIASAISSGKVAAVNIYIDEEVDKWYAHMGEYPSEWHNGYDPNFIIRTDLLYNVRAIPSLYILDKEKNVILKDAPEQRAAAFLRSL